jgi:DNA-directed RNA polymerase specialized sigma24 family protein
MTDQAIITLIRADQSDKALDALYRFFPAVRKMIRGNGGNRQDAEDIFQEALIILCKRITETDFILTAQLSTYLFSVSRYLWKDESQKRRLFVADTPELSEEESDMQAAVQKERDARLAEKVLL